MKDGNRDIITRRTVLEFLPCATCKKATKSEKDFNTVSEPVPYVCERCYQDYCDSVRELVDTRFQLVQMLIWKSGWVFTDMHKRLCKPETLNAYHQAMKDWADIWNQRVYEVFASRDVSAMKKMEKALRKELEKRVAKIKNERRTEK